jgi:hypothetical protein
MGNRDTKFILPKNELFYYDEDAGVSKPLVRGSSMPITGVQQKILEAFEDIDGNVWDIKQGTGDVVAIGGNTAGSGYVKISKSLIDEDQETVFTSKFIVKPAFRFGFGMSLSQRIMHQRFSIELVGVDANGNEVATMPLNAPIAVTALNQSTTTLTVTTATPHGFVPADRINLSGCADSRFNYGDLLVNTVVSPTQFTVIATPSGAIPSVTATATTALVSKVEIFSYADNAMGVLWEGTSANNAKLSTRSNKSVLFNSNDTSMGSNNTVATVANANGFADAFNPSHLYDIRIKTENIIVRTMPVDSNGGYVGSMKRSQVIPDITTGYKIRIRAKNNLGMTKPVAEIANAVKAGSTTATITTGTPHGLTTGDQIQIYGMRDQTNFANLTTATAVASVVNSTTFTVAFGGSYTGNSRGGVVIKVNGGSTIAPSAQSIQSVSVAGGLMTVVGSGSWTGFSIGETVELMGMADNTTGSMYSNLEGVYQVANISTTSLVLYTPNQADLASINVGGAVIKRTDFRLHLLRVLDYTRQTVEIDSGMGNYGDAQEAIPVGIATGNVGISGNPAIQGITGHGVNISGNPMRLAGRALNANYASVATGQVADLVTTLVGALVTKPYSIPEGDWTYAGATPISTTADVAMRAVQGTGIRSYVTGIQLKNVGATATEVVIKDGATVIWRGHLSANMPQTDTIVFNTPLKTTANTALNIAIIASTGASVYVSAQGYTAP